MFLEIFDFSQENLLNGASSKLGYLQKMGPQCVSPMEMETEQYQNSFTNRKQPINREGIIQEQLGARAVPYRRVRSISGTSQYSDSDGKVRLCFAVCLLSFFKFQDVNFESCTVISGGFIYLFFNHLKGYISSDFAQKPQANQPADLTITNLDPTIDTKELRRLLTNMIKEFAMVSRLLFCLSMETWV